MLEIAGGVILGGIFLWILAAFAETLIPIALVVVAAALGIGLVVALHAHPESLKGLIGIGVAAGVFWFINKRQNYAWARRVAEERKRNDPRIWIREPVRWVDLDHASKDGWKTLKGMALSGPDVFGVTLHPETDGMAAMRALSAVDRTRDLSYTYSDDCLYVWRKRSGE